MRTRQKSQRYGRRIRSGVASTSALLLLLGLATVVAQPVDAGIASPPQVAQPAQPAQAGPDVPDSGRFLEPVFDEVDVTLDVPYRDTVDVDGNAVTLRLDLYEPAEDTAETRPAIIWMHGGFFAFGDKSSMEPFAMDFARRGYVAVSLQYRLRPDLPLFVPGIGEEEIMEIQAALLDAYDDARAGVQWLKDSADELRIDPDAIAAGGYSAGAANAVHLAYLPGDLDRPADPTGIAAAAPIAAASAGTPEPGDPPVIAFHGSADSTVPFNLALDTCAAARAAGVRFDFVVFDGEGHSINFTRFDEIVQSTANFLAEVVLAPQGFFGDPFQPPPPPLPDPDPCEPQPSEPPPVPPEPAPREPRPAEPVVVQPSFTG